MRSASLQTSAGTAFRCCPSTFGSILPCSVRVRPKMKIAGEEAKEIQILRTCYYSFARPLRTAGRCSLKNPRAWSASLNQVVKRTAKHRLWPQIQRSQLFFKKWRDKKAQSVLPVHSCTAVAQFSFFFFKRTWMNVCWCLFLPSSMT